MFLIPASTHSLRLMICPSLQTPTKNPLLTQNTTLTAQKTHCSRRAVVISTHEERKVQLLSVTLPSVLHLSHELPPDVTARAEHNTLVTSMNILSPPCPISQQRSALILSACLFKQTYAGLFFQHERASIRSTVKFNMAL